MRGRWQQLQRSLPRLLPSARVGPGGAVRRQGSTKTTLIKVVAAAQQQVLKLRSRVSEVTTSVAEAEATSQELQDMTEFMKRDLAQIEQQPLWKEALSEVYDRVAAGLAPDERGERELGLVGAAEQLLAALNQAHPSMAPTSAAFLLRHEDAPNALVVKAASERAMEGNARVKPTALWHKSSKASVSAESFRALESSKAILRSPHGKIEDARSVVPLRSPGALGGTFGVLLTGPPAIPDELAEAMARCAGPLLARAWRLEKVQAIMNAVALWVRKKLSEMEVGADVLWAEGATARLPEPGALEWQPLPHLDGDSMRTFQLELRWAAANNVGPIGLLTIELRSSTALDEKSLEVLMACVPMIRELISQFETAGVGATRVPTHEALDDAYNLHSQNLPERLHEMMAAQLRKLDTQATILELRGYGQIDEVQSVITALLCIFGSRRDEVSTWQQVQAKLNSMVVSNMISADLGAIPPLCWSEARAAMADVDVESMLCNAAHPVRIVLKWLTIARFVRKARAAHTPTADARPSRVRHLRRAHGCADHARERRRGRARGAVQPRHEGGHHEPDEPDEPRVAAAHEPRDAARDEHRP